MMQDTLKPQIINDGEGKPAFAVIPYDSYISMIEDAEDLVLLAEARTEGGESFSMEEVERMIEHRLSPVAIFRERHSMTQAELAERVGSSAAYISQIETGRRNPGAKMRRKLAAALGVAPDDLV